MDLTATGIITKANDYRENDRLVRLLTADNQIITAVIKGVKKAGAKLKFAAQPFSFCDFELAEKNGRYTVKNCVQKEDLFAVTFDVSQYTASCCVIETADIYVSSAGTGDVFIMVLKTLKNILYGDCPPSLSAAKFIQKLLSMSGFSALPVGGKGVRGIYFDISKEYLGELGKLNISDSDSVKTLAYACAQFENTYEKKLNSLKFLKQ